MKSRETKQKDLVALTESLQNSKSAMVVSFSKLTVTKDQEFRHSLREAGANYQVVKNTLARIAVKGTQFEGASEYFKGVTAIAWTDNDPVVLTKAISKFLKDNSDVYNFKGGVLEGSVIDFAQLQSIASLPSKEELISKLLYVLNSSAQRIVTVINAVPRNLAVVIKQIGEQKEAVPEAKAEAVQPTEVEESAGAPAQTVPEGAPSTEAATASAAPVVDADAGEQAAVPDEPLSAEVEAAAPAEEDLHTGASSVEQTTEVEVEASPTIETEAEHAASAAPQTEGVGDEVDAAQDDTAKEIKETAPEAEKAE